MIVATQGRSIWILDDLNIIWDELKQSTSENELRLFSVYPSVGYGGGGDVSATRGTNHPEGVRFYFNSPKEKDTVEMSFFTNDGELIRSFSTNAKEKGDQLKVEKGMNVFNWNTRYEQADEFEGLLMWWGTLNGPKCPPGVYTARLKVGSDSVDVQFEILLDPRSEGSVEDRQAQFQFLLDIRNKLDETHDAIADIREIKSQIAGLNKRIDRDDYPKVVEEGKRLDSLMNSVEKTLYQTKLKSNQDMLNYPIMLNNKLAHVASLANMGVYRPPDQMIQVKDELTSKIDIELAKWYDLRDKELLKYNELIRTERINFIGVKDE